MKKEPLTNYQIVEFQPEYTTQVIGIIGRVLRDQKVIPESDEPIDDEDLYRITDIYSGRARFWVALKDKQVIGTVAIMDLGHDTAKLNRMFVLTKYHGKGVGQELLNHVLLFAKQQEFKEVVLNTHLFMKRAHRFYEKNGFKKVGEEKDKYHYRIDLDRYQTSS